MKFPFCSCVISLHLLLSSSAMTFDLRIRLFDFASSRLNESRNVAFVKTATCSFALATLPSRTTPSLIVWPRAKSSINTPTTTEAIKRDSSLWYSSLSALFFPAGWWCKYHSPPHPMTTSAAAINSNTVQNQNDGTNSQPIKKEEIVTKIREITFGVMLLASICFFWINWFSGHPKKKQRSFDI